MFDSCEYIESCRYVPPVTSQGAIIVGVIGGDSVAYLYNTYFNTDTYVYMYMYVCVDLSLVLIKL